MTQRSDGGPAFPRPDWNGSWMGPDSYSGMTLRDWFAGQVIGGFLASTAHPQSTGPAAYTAEEIARNAYKAADAMLKEREK